MWNVAKRLTILFLAFSLLGSIAQSAWAVTLGEEIDLGFKIDAEIMRDNRLYQDSDAQKEINTYGKALVKHVKRPNIEYYFKILDDDTMNAFSIPGGYVYFTSRLWNVLREDERKGVIAHEIMHVDERHALDAISKQRKRQTILSVILIATKASRLAGDVASMAEQLYSLKFSRADEEEADTGAVEMCKKAEYNPAGILLAMYKIRRFEDEAGGGPPKIFSDHPPTKERLDYLKKLLATRNIPVPEEKVEDAARADKIGEVTSTDKSTMTFTSSKPLKVGDVVWVTRDGWDSRYEKRTAVPSARGVVTALDASNYTAQFWMFANSKKWPVAKGMEVYAPPLPELKKGIGMLVADSGKYNLKLDSSPQLYDRLLAQQIVWNKDNTQLIVDSAGYVVVSDPQKPSGYVGVQRAKYSYAPMESGAQLVKYNDPDQKRWVGPVLSIGRRNATIEIPSLKLDSSGNYDVLYPAWNSTDTYEQRRVGKARWQSGSGGKVVLKLELFSPGWSIADVQNGFDVYETAPEK